MFVCEDAANGGDNEKNKHDGVDGEVGGFLEILREGEGDDGKDGSDHHDVGGREAGLAGAVGAGVPDEDFVENDVGNDHEDERDEHGQDGFVDFFQ